MKTYFIAGSSEIKSDSRTWHFFRVWDESEDIHPSEVIEKKIKELENDSQNLGHWGERGNLMITQFNAL